MGQTLTHGVYLPNEGERNCYSGLAANWRLLDGAIGTIAAHTTAIAGKADISHTHGNITNDGKVGTTANLPLITGTGGAVQAGSFGNAANTFCEGNDSRLSDARTPVAHTHTKSDVTDLFNSNFIPSANDAYDLGSSSYQWNNLYAKNYFYNGTAWGLDKANVWSGDNTFTAIISYQTSYTLGNPPQSTQAQQVIRALDAAGTNYLAQISTYQDTVATGLRFTVRDKFDSNGFSPSGSNRNKYFYFLQNTSNQGYLKWDGYVNNSIYPLANNTYDLGSSTLKWKSLNGINPGALSLPNVRSAVADPISTVGWNLSGSRNKYTPTEDGWFYIRVAGTGSCAINIHNGDTDNSYPTWFNTSTGGYATLVVPCEKGISLYIYISATSIEYCSFHPCLGNV